MRRSRYEHVLLYTVVQTNTNVQIIHETVFIHKKVMLDFTHIDIIYKKSKYIAAPSQAL